MTEEIQVEFSMLMYAFAFGVFMRLIFDGLELLRKTVFRGRLFSALLDILYWMMAAGMVYGIMYRYASGVLRGIIILFALLGIAFTSAFDKKAVKKVKKRVKNG